MFDWDNAKWDTIDWMELTHQISNNYRSMKQNNAEIRVEKIPVSIMPAYFEIQMLISEEIVIPKLFINYELSMSITPMEIQSHINPIRWAKGNVLVAGLGLGYFINQIKNLKRVKSIHVVEINQNVIDLYIKHFGAHPKVHIHNKNIFEFDFQGDFNEDFSHFDYFYADIWNDRSYKIGQLPDMKKIIGKNGLIKSLTYSFWGLEEYIYYRIVLYEEKFEDVINELKNSYGLDFSVLWKEIYDMLVNFPKTIQNTEYRTTLIDNFDYLKKHFHLKSKNKS